MSFFATPFVRTSILLAGLAGLAACSGGGFGNNNGNSAHINNNTKFSSAEYGVAASPRVTSSADIPKGGGRYQVGQAYQVAGRWFTPAEQPNFDQTGTASWYGPNFHGRLTANGEIFDQYHLSGAHPTLPLPSYVRVENLANGRSVIVRINDRGPFAHNRLIDVSRRTAEVLDFIQSGTAQVRVTYVGQAPLEGDDTPFLVASINAPDLAPPTPQTPDQIRTMPTVDPSAPIDLSRGFDAPFGRPANGLTTLMSLFSYAEPVETAFTGAAAAVTDLATGDAALIGPLPQDVGTRTEIILGQFASLDMAGEVATIFAALGAVDHRIVDVNGASMHELALVVLKPGVLPSDVDLTKSQYGL